MQKKTWFLFAFACIVFIGLGYFLTKDKRGFEKYFASEKEVERGPIVKDKSFDKSSAFPSEIQLKDPNEIDFVWNVLKSNTSEREFDSAILFLKKIYSSIENPQHKLEQKLLNVDYLSSLYFQKLSEALNQEELQELERLQKTDLLQKFYRQENQYFENFNREGSSLFLREMESLKKDQDKENIRNRILEKHEASKARFEQIKVLSKLMQELSQEKGELLISQKMVEESEKMKLSYLTGSMELSELEELESLLEKPLLIKERELREHTITSYLENLVP